MLLNVGWKGMSVDMITCRLLLPLFAHLSFDSDTELVWLIWIRSTREPVGHV